MQRLAPQNALQNEAVEEQKIPNEDWGGGIVHRQSGWVGGRLLGKRTIERTV